MIKRLLYTISAVLVCAALNAQEVPVKYEELPAAAKTFLKEHFKSPFHHAIKEVESRKVTYEAVLEDATEIEFNDAGKWREIDGRGKAIPYTFIQKQILDYVRLNHPKTSIVKIELDEAEYKVKLSNNLGLEFDSLGVFKKID